VNGKQDQITGKKGCEGKSKGDKQDGNFPRGLICRKVSMQKVTGKGKEKNASKNEEQRGVVLSPKVGPNCYLLLLGAKGKKIIDREEIEESSQKVFSYNNQ